MSDDDGLRRRNIENDESADPSLNSSDAAEESNVQQPLNTDRNAAVVNNERTAWLNTNNLLSGVRTQINAVHSAVGRGLRSALVYAFGETIIEVGEAIAGYDYGTVFDVNANLNEREIPEEFVNPNPTQIHTVRQRLFRTIFTKIVLLFVLSFPHRVRKAVEYGLLFAAVTCLFTLIYLHAVFVQRPQTCLEGVPENWTTDGILRLEVLSKAEQRLKQVEDLIALQQFKSKSNLTQFKEQFDFNTTEHFFSTEEKSPANYTTDDDRYLSIDSPNVSTVYFSNGEFKQINTTDMMKSNTSDDSLGEAYLKQYLELKKTIDYPSEEYAIEFSVEHGFLRLSSKTRRKLNIPVKVVYLDPEDEKCFGDRLSRSLLKYFFGYNDILMNSLKYLAEKENNRGYVYNVVTGDHYRFVNVWMSRTSYFAAAFIMLVFTLTISMLLRYSHHQVFVFVAQLTQLLEFNSPVSFPFAPLLTVILALVGMEAIMTEFFNDNTTAFYIILIVWTADQYDWFCCHTSITRRHWLKFFYLYHFAFYAYVYRFSGQYSDLALLTSWLFILHSMVFFFHRYELPRIMTQSARITITAQVHHNARITQVSLRGNTLTFRLVRPNDSPDESEGAIPQQPEAPLAPELAEEAL